MISVFHVHRPQFRRALAEPPFETPGEMGLAGETAAIGDGRDRKGTARRVGEQSVDSRKPTLPDPAINA